MNVRCEFTIIMYNWRSEKLNNAINLLMSIEHWVVHESMNITQYQHYWGVVLHFLLHNMSEKFISLFVFYAELNTEMMCISLVNYSNGIYQAIFAFVFISRYYGK